MAYEKGPKFLHGGHHAAHAAVKKVKKIATAGNVAKAATHAGLGLILAQDHLKTASKALGNAANKHLSKVHDLKKQAGSFADAAAQFRGAPSSKGHEIAKNFAKSSKKAFSSAAKSEKIGNALGKASQGLSKIAKHSGPIGAGLVAVGATAALIHHYKSKKVAKKKK